MGKYYGGVRIILHIYLSETQPKNNHNKALERLMMKQEQKQKTLSTYPWMSLFVSEEPYLDAVDY